MNDTTRSQPPRTIAQGQLLWRPDAARAADSNLSAYRRWLAQHRGLAFNDYAALWQWSVDDLQGFWQSIWDYFGVQASVPAQRVLGRAQMPGAEWFPGARLNFAEHVLQRRGDDEALLFMSEQHALGSLSWTELGDAVRRMATQLRSLGVVPGDRVVGYLPNIPETVIAMLATTSIGAIWSCCSADYGTRGVLDRFSQLAPKVLFCVDGYTFGGRPFDRREAVRSIIEALPMLAGVVYLPHLMPNDGTPPSPHTTFWSDCVAGPRIPAEEFAFAQVPFSHPLWILFSSGTTGLPKPIVHGHGGILLETLKCIAFQMDLRPQQRAFFFTTAGWMVWNTLIGALAVGAVPVLYDGSPAYPSLDVLWKMASQARVTLFAASPTYVQNLQKAGIVPRERFDLTHLRTVMLAGSPATPESMAWFYDNVKADLWVQSGSGGTDVCSGFVGGVPGAPVRAGEIQGRLLGVAAYSFNERGEPVLDEVGELVITKPMPSMPLYFWNDAQGSRYAESYFNQYANVWRHGDFFTLHSDGSCLVLGRSDATLNRYGIRIGTAEIYRSLSTLAFIDDALIVNLDLPEGRFFMPLFVKLRDGHELDEALREQIRRKLRQDYSPRHVPDKILGVTAIPSTLTGKKLEVPVRRILMGVPVDQAVNLDAAANPQAIEYFVDYARTQTDYSLT